MSKIARQGYKPLTFAFKDINIQDFEELQKTFGNFESEESRTHLEQNLQLVATFGFQDVYWKGVSQTIAKLRETNTITRLISGDHRDVVIHTLVSLGMIDRDQIDGIISGKELSDRMEGLFEEYYDSQTQRKRLHFIDDSKKEDFTKLKDDVKAVYRASSEDKYKFVSGLSELTLCSYTGKSFSDANALTAASVGFAMGKVGSDVAKQEADIVLLDDDFNSIFNAVRWGRNVFDNVKKFLQF